MYLEVSSIPMKALPHVNLYNKDKDMLYADIIHVNTKNSNIIRLNFFCPMISPVLKSKKISIDKNDMLAKLEIELNEPLSKDEVLSALPTGKFRVSKT